MGGGRPAPGAYIALAPTGRSPPPPMGQSNSRPGARGRLRPCPIGPPPCLTGQGRASLCCSLCRARPVPVPRAMVAAQARPDAWHGPSTSPQGHGPDRVSVVLSWAGTVLAQRARPSWPAIASDPNPCTGLTLTNHISEPRTHQFHLTLHIPAVLFTSRSHPLTPRRRPDRRPSRARASLLAFFLFLYFFKMFFTEIYFWFHNLPSAGRPAPCHPPAGR